MAICPGYAKLRKSSGPAGSRVVRWAAGAGGLPNPYAVLWARATVQPHHDAWDLLNRLAKSMSPADTEFPAPRGPATCALLPERIGGSAPLRAARRGFAAVPVPGGAPSRPCVPCWSRGTVSAMPAIVYCRRLTHRCPDYLIVDTAADCRSRVRKVQKFRPPTAVIALVQRGSCGTTGR